MDIHQKRINSFKDFKESGKPLYVIYTEIENSKVPCFVFRKVDSEKIAILAWMDIAEAENWRKQRGLNASRVVALTYFDFMRLIEGLTPDQRKMHTIELI